MSKLFNLKKWLTVADAARHLAIVFGEDVTEADVFRLALDHRLRLSVYFVNQAVARPGKVIPIGETKCEELRSLDSPFLLTKGVPTHVIKLEEGLTSLYGVYDLSMYGSEQLDIENIYQHLTGGPAVTLVSYDGAFVEREEGLLFQLQEINDGNEDDGNEDDGNENVPVSNTLQEKRKLKEAFHCIPGGAHFIEQLDPQTEEWKDLVKMINSKVKGDSYYRAGGLPEDRVLVVRTDELREFEQATLQKSSKNTANADRNHVADKLARMNQAALRFWEKADRNDRSTHPNNADVAKWLVQHGFSLTLADKAATIIRPEWAPTGRKPEE